MKIKWGIIGAGTIAHRFADSLAEVENAELYAVANRTKAKAIRFKKDHPCEKTYDNYADLLKDEKIDAVYIALPHKYHFEWIEKTIYAGKAVLCEKPATLFHAEMVKVSSLAKQENIFFMEAMKSRFTPAYKEVKQLVTDGAIGEIIHISTSLCRVFPLDEASYHYQPIQGGCLLDMGVYNAALIEDFIEGPFDLKAVDYELYNEEIEIYIKAEFQSGDKTAILESAFDRETETQACITGTKGKIILPDFHRSKTYEIHSVDLHKVVEKPYIVDDFYGEITHVMDCLENGQKESPIMSLEHSENVATMLDQIKAKIQ